MAGLQDTIDELDKEAGEEVVVAAEEIEEVAPEPVPEAAPQPTPEAPKTVETAPVDNNGWAKLRWEAAEANREKDRLAAEIAELKKPKVVVPNKEENVEAYFDHEIGTTKAELSEIKKKLADRDQQDAYKQQREAAWGEFTDVENNFKAQTPDYEDVGSFGIKVISNSLRVLNPHMTQRELGETVQEIVLKKAAAYARAGLNPVQALYNEAKGYGYQPKPADEPAAGEPRRPVLAKVAENKKKSTNMGSSGGSGSALPTNDAVLNMTNAERSKLTESDWARLEQESA